MNIIPQYAAISRVPFPAKKTFQNTDRHVLEHRMVVLNEFLRVICQRAEDNAEILSIVRDFMEPDTNDKKMHGGTVIRTVMICILCIWYSIKKLICCDICLFRSRPL